MPEGEGLAGAGAPPPPPAHFRAGGADAETGACRWGLGKGWASAWARLKKGCAKCALGRGVEGRREGGQGARMLGPP